jgi:hypothetical protein
MNLDETQKLAARNPQIVADLETLAEVWRTAAAEAEAALPAHKRRTRAKSTRAHGHTKKS